MTDSNDLIKKREDARKKLLGDFYEPIENNHELEEDPMPISVHRKKRVYDWADPNGSSDSVIKNKLYSFNPDSSERPDEQPVFDAMQPAEQYAKAVKDASIPKPLAGKTAEAPNSPLTPPPTTSPARTANTAVRAEAGQPADIMRTYRGDTADSIKNNNESLASIALAEQAKRRGLKETALQNKQRGGLKKFLKTIAVVIVFFVLGFGLIAGGWWFLTIRKEANPSSDTLSVETPIVYDNQSSISTSELVPSIRSALQNELERLKPPVNTVHRLIFTAATDTEERALSAAEFIDTLETEIPDYLIRALDPDRHMFGWFNNGETISPFLVLTATSFEQLYPGMLDWEQNLASDLAGLFDLDETRGETILFSDSNIENVDIRKGSAGNSKAAILYGFLDNTTVLITTDKGAFAELSRLYLSTSRVN